MGDRYIKGRLVRMDAPAETELEDEQTRAEDRAMLVESAKHANVCRDRERYPEPIFEIREGSEGSLGRVFAARDGKELTRYVHTLAEQWYWDFLADFGPSGPRGLIHDPATEAFYKPEPPYEMVFSRERCYINRFFWAMGDDRAHISPRDPLPGPDLAPERAAELSSEAGA